MDYFFKKDFTCPVCKNKFQAHIVRNSRVKVAKTYDDYYKEYANVNPIHYEIVICPHCGYSAFKNEFKKLPVPVVERIQTKIGENWTKQDYNRQRSIEEAIQSFKLALMTEMAGTHLNSKLAKICLRLSWLYREIGSEDEEKKYMKHAIKNYEQAYKKESLKAQNELLALKMTGILYYKLENYKKSSQWLQLVLQNENIDKFQVIKKQTREFLGKVTDAYRKQKKEQEKDE